MSKKAVSLIMGLFSLILLPISPVSANTYTIGDQFNYTATDPSAAIWDVDQQQGIYGQHDLWVSYDGVSGHLYSRNNDCTYWSHTLGGCSADAILVSKHAHYYSPNAGEKLMLTERYSPNVETTNVCEQISDWNKIHFASMRYEGNSGSDGARVSLVVLYSCAYPGAPFTFEVFAEGYKPDGTCCFSFKLVSGIQPDEWIDLSIESQDGRTWARVGWRGDGWSVGFDSKMTTLSGYVEMKLDYIHNDYSRTDYSLLSRITDLSYDKWGCWDGVRTVWCIHLWWEARDAPYNAQYNVYSSGIFKASTANLFYDTTLPPYEGYATYTVKGVDAAGNVEPYGISITFYVGCVYGEPCPERPE